MPSTKIFEMIKIWTPRVATIIVGIILLLAFWGVLRVGFQFFGISSYFSPEINSEPPAAGIDEEQAAKLKTFLQERNQKRNSIRNSVNTGQKDPFNLP